ncbi:ATPase [Mycobacterium sp. PSTR-4-N]|uniref:ATPase n=1 Tax=Mycobacterium sp. PSTR-4-N TaxID=2917745 RepID=UPI001F14A26E|nr:ATPase [Mycobacterium sp. PSTR-4-N]
MRWMLTLALAFSGVFLASGEANAVPGFCPPTCDAIPDAAWVESSSLPLASIYRWPSLAGLAVTAPAPRFEFESWCVTPESSTDPRRYAVAARATVPNPDGQWNLQVQVIHWRGDVVTGGQTALEVLEKARIALASCGDGVSPSLTTNEADRIAAVISEAGSRVMRTYLLADPASSTIVEAALWTTLPTRVEWRAVPDAQIFDALAAPLCAAYLGSCR